MLPPIGSSVLSMAPEWPDAVIGQLAKPVQCNTLISRNAIHLHPTAHRCNPLVVLACKQHGMAWHGMQSVTTKALLVSAVYTAAAMFPMRTSKHSTESLT